MNDGNHSIDLHLIKVYRLFTYFFVIFYKYTQILYTTKDFYKIIFIFV